MHEGGEGKGRPTCTCVCMCLIYIRTYVSKGLYLLPAQAAPIDYNHNTHIISPPTSSVHLQKPSLCSKSQEAIIMLIACKHTYLCQGATEPSFWHAPEGEVTRFKPYQCNDICEHCVRSCSACDKAICIGTYTPSVVAVMVIFTQYLKLIIQLVQPTHFQLIEDPQ